MSFSIDEFIKKYYLELSEYEINYLKEIDSFPKLSLREENALIYEAKTNNDLELRKQLIGCCLRHVLPIAKNYLGRGFCLFDLIEEGNKGLIIAYEKYKIERETLFRGCIYYYVKRSICASLFDNSRMIRIPSKKYETNIDFIKALNILEHNTKRNLSVEEIAEELNYSVEFVYEVLLTIKTIVSLEELQEKESLTSNDSFFRDEELIYEDDLNDFYDEEFISSLKTFLSPKKIEMLMLKAGLIDGKSWSFEEIGARYGVTRQAVKNSCSRISKNKKLLKLL